MPMLERTAASLEPCHFQRVLPPTKTPFKSRRRLHTAFWQHGAADIELTSVWQTLVREPLESFNLFPATQSHSSPTRSESLGASSFLLDFLYPQGATSLLRKLSPSVLDRYERPKLYLRGSIPRLFTSSASLSHESQGSGQGAAATGSSGDHDQDAFAHDDASAQVETSMMETSMMETSMMETSMTEDLEDQGSDLDADFYKEFGDEEGQGGQGSDMQGYIETRKTVLALARFQELVPKDDGADFDEIWRAYCGMKLADKKAHRNQFLDYAVMHRRLEHLLARAIEAREWGTLWGIWEWFPPARRRDAERLDFKELERVLSIDQIINGALTIAARIQHARRQPERLRPTPELSGTLRKKVVMRLVSCYVERCNPELHIKMLSLLKDRKLYEEFLEYTTGTFDKKALDQLYCDYRRLPNVKIRGHIMHAMMNNVYYPDDPLGMEKVMHDFYARFGRLDIGAYRKCLKFYSRRGDLAYVTRLWEEFKTHYAKERLPPPDFVMTEHSRPDFVHLLNVHAVRGELGEVRRVFSKAQSEFGPKLNAYCWNILLNAHAKAMEYDAAVRVFGVLRQAVPPDEYSYGTMMGMTGSRGDLEFTLELYRMAKSEGLRPNVTMVDCVVEAYCQNDKYNDAESIVAMTTKEQRFSPRELVVLWNTLLHHHASRRDLTAVNRLLGEMTGHDITYDSDTYSCLLRGLALCKQPHHALFLVQQAVKTHAFKPTLQHYGLLMSAFLQSGQPSEALRTSAMLRNLGIPKSADILVRVFKALGSWAQSPPGGPDAAKSQAYLVSALRQFRLSIEWSQKPEKARLPGTSPDSKPWIQQTASPNLMRARTNQASVLIFIFTQMRQIATVQEILQLWRSSSPETSNMQQPPLKLLQSLMLSAFYERNYKEVRNIWRLVLDRVTQASRVSAPGTRRDGPLPSLRYSLCDPLKTMQRTCAATSDVEGLREAVASVQRAGFRLDSKNLNYYVQILAEHKKWREAFMVCEEQLMPHWRGWKHQRRRMANVRTELPLAMRRRGTDPHNPRPIVYTLTVLAKAYMDLEQMTAWSTEAERLLAYIVAKAPSAVSAVRTQLRSKTNALDIKIFGGDLAEELERAEARRKSIAAAAAGAGPGKDGDMPETFQEMLLAAGSGKGLDVEEEGWGWGDEASGGLFEDDGDISGYANTDETTAPAPASPKPAKSPAKAPRKPRKRAAAAAVEEDHMPETFREMIRTVEDGKRTPARRRDWTRDDEKEVPDGQRECERDEGVAAADAVSSSAAETAPAATDEEWYDVDEQSVDNDEWTPMGPGGARKSSSRSFFSSDAEWDEVRDAEAEMWRRGADAPPAPPAPPAEIDEELEESSAELGPYEQQPTRGGGTASSATTVRPPSPSLSRGARNKGKPDARGERSEEGTDGKGKEFGEDDEV